jgi:hypothetical protein
MTVLALLAVVPLASKRSRHEATSMSAGSRLLLFAAALELFNPSSAKFLIDFLRLLGLSCREDRLKIA